MKNERILSYTQSRELKWEELAGVSAGEGTSHVSAVVTNAPSHPDYEARVNYDI